MHPVHLLCGRQGRRLPRPRGDAPPLAEPPTRQREPAHLQHRLAVQSEDPGSLPAAVPLDEHEMPNRRRSPRRTSPAPQNGEPIHWPDFAPPASAVRRRSSGLLCHRPTQAYTSRSSAKAASKAGTSPAFIGAIWPQIDFTTLHSQCGTCLASYAASTGGNSGPGRPAGRSSAPLQPSARPRNFPRIWGCH